MQSKTSDYSEHRALLIDHLIEVHGPLSAKIADRLLAVGTSTLKDLADYLRLKEPFGDEATSVVRGAGAASAGVLHTSQIPVGSATQMRHVTDKEVKFALATLLQHNIVAFDKHSNTYCVLVAQGLLQFLLPCFIRFVRADLGDAGDVVISVLARYSKLTLGAIRREVLRSVPFAEKDIRDAIRIMVDRKWIVACGESSSSSASAPPPEKKYRSEGGGNDAPLDDTTPYEISFTTLLSGMRTAAVRQFFADRFNALGCRILTTMLEYDASVSATSALAIKQRGNVNTFDSQSSIMRGLTDGNTTEEMRRRLQEGFGGAPQLPPLSSALSMNELHRYASSGVGPSSHAAMAAPLLSSSSASSATSLSTLPRLDMSDVSQETFVAKIRELCNDDFGGILQEGALGGSSSSSAAGAGPGYVLNYSRALTAMRDRFVEKVVFSHYGVVGTRILKLLMQKQAYGDRHLAEECICTLYEAREALLGLQRDGYVRQIEIPKAKVDYNAERNPKNSNYLWAVNREAILVHVRKHLATAIRNTRARLLFEYKRLEELFPSEFLKGVHTLLNGGSAVTIAPSANCSATNNAAVNNGAPQTDANGFSITAGRGTLTLAQHEDLLKLRFACRALQTTQLAQMEMMLMMDYY